MTMGSGLVSPRTTTSRLPSIDAIKGIGCIAIVLHHLAFYGPMSDVVHQAAPQLIDGLYDHARLAVQTFLVLAGYLVAASFAPDGRPVQRGPLSLVWKRYARLGTPLLFAVALAMLITALVRPWFVHDSLSAAPTVPQLLAHALLLQDVLGFEALSAGVWYVAIDFQLFVATLLLTVLIRRSPVTWVGAFPALIIVLAAVSLLYFNRHDEYDAYAPYFFGAYGLGMLAWWAARSSFARAALIAIALLGGGALWLETRAPIAVALATALLVGVAGQRGWLGRWPRPGILTWVGQRSYSVFLVHYGVVVGFNAVWHATFPTGAGINALGMLAATFASITAGAVLYRHVETRPAVLGPNWTTGILVVMVVATLAIEAIG